MFLRRLATETKPTNSRFYYVLFLFCIVISEKGFEFGVSGKCSKSRSGSFDAIFNAQQFVKSYFGEFMSVARLVRSGRDTFG